MNYKLKCIECNRSFEDDSVRYVCDCGGLLEVSFSDDYFASIDKNTFSNRKLGVWKYKELMPVKNKKNIVSISEGGTPLYHCKSLSKDFGMDSFYVKNEGSNVTGSFKDRGMTLGVTKAIDYGIDTVACASTGNTSASLAVYAARSGLNCVVLLPAKKVALGKVAQALFHGAKVIALRGNFDEALNLIRRFTNEGHAYLLNSLNPFRLEGQKSMAFEIVDQLNGGAPDRIIIPVGNAGNISALWKGFKEFKKLGIIDKLPKMTGIQAEGAKPIVNAYKDKKDDIIAVKNPETIATAIRIGDPVNAKKALRAIYESGGLAESVTDDEIIQAQLKLARKEGIGVEPASASSIAGLYKLLKNNMIDKNEKIVCITTGHLLKDPEQAVNSCREPIEIEADFDKLLEVVKS